MNSNLNILLVDEGPPDASLATHVSRECANTGLRLTQAASLEEGLLEGSEGFDLVVLALDAGDERKFDLVDRLVDSAGNTPIVLLTARPDDALSAHALSLGVQDHVVEGDGGSGELPRTLRKTVLRQRVHAALVARQTPTIPASTKLDGWLGTAPMSATLPHVHDDLVTSIADVLVLAANSDADKATGVLMLHVPTLAARLAMLTATPADVAGILRAAAGACARRSGGGGDPRSTSVHCELLLIALLAALCEQYERDSGATRALQATQQKRK